MELLLVVMVLAWAVATCMSNCEASAALRLGRQGIESYHPRFRQLGAVSGTATRPLFPGYLFVRQGAAWRSVLGTRGIVGMILDAGKPALLSERVIQDVRDREGREGLVELPDPYRIGAKVQIVRGALFGQEGICAGMNDERRVFVFLQFLGQQVKTRFERADLVLA